MAGYQGYFIWHELMSTDPARAREFYTATLGWDTEDAGIPDLDYTLWKTERSPVGGLMQLPAEAAGMGAPTHWIPYVGTADIAASFDKGVSLGARVYVPVTDIPDIGQFAVLGDPQGATFAIYQPFESGDGDVRPEPGDFSWHELGTTDARAALQFYGELLGWEIVESHDMGPMGIYHLYGRDGHTFGGMFDRNSGPPAWLCYVRVASADDAATRVVSNGGTVLNGPMEVPGGDRIAQCRDPQGGVFAVHQMP